MKNAEENFARRIAVNRYPGRGIVMGLAENGREAYQLYWIMGRSAGSRNRVLCARSGRVWTEAADPAKLADPALLIYEAMLEIVGCYLVSNGDHTRTLADGLLRGESFEQALATREREPDAPHYTPRIAGMVRLVAGVPEFRFALLRANRCNPAFTDRSFHQLAPPAPGFGYGITTYEDDGNPLPSFEGDPLLLPLKGDPQEILDGYFQALDEENRIAMALKSVDLASGASQVLLAGRQK